jgi:hypothetical protein
MAAMRYLILDIATAPLPDAETYLEGSVRAPSNYKDEAKIAEYIAEKQAERLQMAATDVDLARVTGVCYRDHQGYEGIGTPRAEDAEKNTLATLAEHLTGSLTVITYGGFNFDLPLLMRRARYLGVDFPKLNLDRYRSPHLDLCELLSDRDFKRRRPLGFYVKRLGWTDLQKTLSGAEEARVPETGRWDDLAASLRHDVTATARLAAWMGLIELPQPTLVEASHAV